MNRVDNKMYETGLDIIVMVLLMVPYCSCQASSGVDILRGEGVSCTASSAHSDYPCDQAYNGDLSPGRSGAWASLGEQNGAWLEIRLPRETQLTSISILSRCPRVDQYSGVDFEFSDGSTETLVLACDGPTDVRSGEYMRHCAGQTPKVLSLSGVRADKINMRFHDSCQSGGNPGLRQIQVHGVEFAGNVLDQANVRCRASSNVGDYGCENLMDGDFSPGVTGSWAAHEPDNDPWVSFKLPHEAILTSITIWSRCTLVDQFSGVNVVFGEDQSQSVTFECDGSTAPNGELWEECEGQARSEIAVNNVRTRYVVLEFVGRCAAGGQPGLREVEIQGYELVENILGQATQCEASSTYPGYPCDNAYDGKLSPNGFGSWASLGGNHGAWLDITLPQARSLLFVNVWSRCTLGDQFRGADLLFDDGTEQQMTFACDGSSSSYNGDLESNCIGLRKNELDIADVRTSSVKMRFHDGCAAGNPGVREVVIEGFVFAGDIMRGPGVACEASSAVRGYPCSNVYNGNLSPGRDGAWASQVQDTGAWLEVTFPREMVVVQVGIWNRCVKVDQYSGVDLVFTDESVHTMAMACDGVRLPANGEDRANCNGQARNDIQVPSVHTTAIRMVFHDSCVRGGHGGIRGVQVQGYASGL